MNTKTFSIISLGCFRNTYDSQVISEKYQKNGFNYISEDNINQGKPQWLLINTCGFIDAAKEESLSIIRGAIDLKKKNFVKKIAVFGCLVKRYQKRLSESFPEIDAWYGVMSNEELNLNLNLREVTYTS